MRRWRRSDKAIDDLPACGILSFGLDSVLFYKGPVFGLSPLQRPVGPMGHAEIKSCGDIVVEPAARPCSSRTPVFAHWHLLGLTPAAG